MLLLWELLLKNKSVDFKHITIHDVPEQSPGFLLWHISTRWRTAIEAVLKAYDLTHPQFVMLAALGWLTKDGQKVTQAAVGAMAGLDPNTTSQIMRGLENKKLIKRVISADVRAKNPLLTPQGSRILMQTLPAVEKADAQFFNAVNKQELASMVMLFQKLMVK